MTWSVREVWAHYGHVVALAGVSLDLIPGSTQAVIGGDGAGKSTLLKVIAGLHLGERGTVDLPPRERVGYVPSGGGTFDDLTVDENMEFVAEAYRIVDWRGRADGLLDRADIGRFSERLAGTLSGGERRKLAACMALLPEPDLLVLDEVTTGVDPVSRMELWRLFSHAAADGAAVLAATTYLDEAERADSALLLHEGRALASGPPGEIVASSPGSVADLGAPTDRATAWRAGRRWRQWSPRPAVPGQARTLEDAAIVLELIATGAITPTDPAGTGGTGGTG